MMGDGMRCVNDVVALMREMRGVGRKEMIMEVREMTFNLCV